MRGELLRYLTRPNILSSLLKIKGIVPFGLAASRRIPGQDSVIARHSYIQTNIPFWIKF